MKEVPLPKELQEASESPWMMLCEDALLAFEVSRQARRDKWSLLIVNL
jgi:hypothetical protein